MKEPLIVDFLEQFLAEHHISVHPRAPSRAASIRSHMSTNGNKSPSSSSRLSVRLSQAELLEYSHHQQHRLNNNSSPSSPISSQHEQPPSKGLSRPTSMTSLDAALTSMEVSDKTNNTFFIATK
jgi:hypothetical protein